MKFLLIFLIALNAFGQASNPNDTLKLGNKGSSADKGLIFETNEGVLNKTLKIDGTSKALKWSGNDMQLGDGASANDKELVIDPASGASLKWNGSDNYVELRNNDIRLGKGSDVDQILEFDIGLGATNPKIKWDSTKQKFRQSIAGTDKDLGSGSGGGGENSNNAITSDQNPNAEDGLTGWTASAGTFALETTDPLEGDQSWNWTPAAQNDTLDSSVLDVDKDIFLGRSCEARIEYIGGDENLTLQVIDADNDVLGEQVLQVHSISGVESVFFLCPNSAGTANDKDLRLRLLNEGATASAIIKFDKAYVGTLLGLSETTLPDSFYARFNGSDAVTLNESNIGAITCSKSGTGDYSCDHSSLNLTSNPVILCSPSDLANNRSCTVENVTTTTFRVRTYVSSSAADNDLTFSINLSKTNADAKQSVQVYKSIPKRAENENSVSVRVNNAGSIQSENVDWLTSCTYNVDRFNCVFDAGVFNVTPACSCNVTDSTQGGCASGNATSTTIDIFTQAPAGTTLARAFDLRCAKQGADYKAPTVQPVLVNQVDTSVSKGITSVACKINNNGSATIDTASGLCESWVTSVNWTATGRVTVNTDVFSANPVCNIILDDNAGNRAEGLQVVSATQINVGTNCSSTMTACDSDFYIQCKGAR